MMLETLEINDEKIMQNIQTEEFIERDVTPTWAASTFQSIQTEPDFDLDIRDDVQDEVSKFGTVKHIFVDKNSAGHVYLRFDTTTSAMSPQRALHGRWFDGRMITAAYMVN